MHKPLKKTGIQPKEHLSKALIKQIVHIYSRSASLHAKFDEDIFLEFVNHCKDHSNSKTTLKIFAYLLNAG